MHTTFWCGDLKRRGHVGNFGVDEMIYIKMSCSDLTWRTWNGLNGLGIILTASFY
jgi:hypothetical protein